MRQLRYSTRGGIVVTRTLSKAPYRKGLKHLLRELDSRRGFYLSSGYEYPGRYSRWDIASTRPLLEIVACGRAMEFRPLNERGEILNRMLLDVLGPHPHWESLALDGGALRGRLKPLPALFPEEERSKQPSAFSILRALTEEFRSEKDSRLALVGAFGYDLLFQFDPIDLKLPRNGVKDLHLLLCDDIFYMDRKKEQIERYEYDFEYKDLATAGVERSGAPVAPPPRLGETGEPVSDHTAEEYAAKVETAARGNAPRRLLRSGSAPHLPHTLLATRPPSCSAACSSTAPARTSSCCNSATSNWWARRSRCSSASKAAASRPAPSRAPRGAPAIRFTTPRASANCSTRPRTSPS